MRINKKSVALTVLLTLMPAIAGTIFNDRLPDAVAVHFDFNGNPDGYADKWVAILGLPLFLAFMQMIVTLAVAYDPANKDANAKPKEMVLWIMPCVSVINCTLLYSYAMGHNTNIPRIACVMFGLLLMILGNYMPKCAPNHTIGIRIYWTLHDNNNWCSTHRFAGRLWTAGGAAVATMSYIMIDNFGWIAAASVLIVLAPIVYSFLYSRKNRC